jgi:hypothetical protein
VARLHLLTSRSAPSGLEVVEQARAGQRLLDPSAQLVVVAERLLPAERRHDGEPAEAQLDVEPPARVDPGPVPSRAMATTVWSIHGRVRSISPERHSLKVRWSRSPVTRISQSPE